MNQDGNDQFFFDSAGCLHLENVQPIFLNQPPRRLKFDLNTPDENIREDL